MGNSASQQIEPGEQVSLKHFKLLRVVGRGAFGKVRIVERKDSGLHFALKYVSKDEIVRQENVRNIVRERKMLEALNHPFLCNLRYSFQDHEFVYLVVDLMTGGDLRFHIERKTFTEEAVRFWIAELGCALQYIHSQGIVHRDVKPDNVLLDSEGHVHLADFNVAAEFTDPRRPLTSKSGTLAYVAPEAMIAKQYKSEVDWWGLGVLLYECIYGRRPFVGKKGGPKLEELVIEAKPKYPLTDPPVEPLCVGAMKKLMSKDVTMRIGANGFQSFTQHPFLQSIDFTALQAKQIQPVFQPSSDKMNFDATYDLEELLLEESPLEARARYQKPRAALRHDASEIDKRIEALHRMIETYFEPFDYQKAHYNRLPVTDASQTLPPDSGAKVRPKGHSRTSSRRSSKQSMPDPAPSTQPDVSAQLERPSIRSPDLVSTPRSLSRASPPRSDNGEDDETTATTAPTTFQTSSSQTRLPAREPIVLPPLVDKTTSTHIQRSRSVSGFERRPSTTQTPMSTGSTANRQPTWGDVTPKKPAASAEEPTRARTGFGRRSGTGMWGLMSKRKGGARISELREGGILGKVGCRIIVAEDGG